MEYRVWNEGGDYFGSHRTRAAAERSAGTARRECQKNCRTNGQEVTPGRGDFKCGVLSPHGVSIQVIDEDGCDRSNDPTY